MVPETIPLPHEPRTLIPRPLPTAPRRPVLSPHPPSRAHTHRHPPRSLAISRHQGTPQRAAPARGGHTRPLCARTLQRKDAGYTPMRSPRYFATEHCHKGMPPRASTHRGEDAISRGKRTFKTSLSTLTRSEELKGAAPRGGRRHCPTKRNGDAALCETG